MRGLHVTHNTERLLLQTTIALACLVPIGGGALGVIFGAALLDHGRDLDLDSHFRYLSGLLLGIGCGLLSTLRDLEKYKSRFTLLAGIVAVGGFSRLLSVVLDGWPAASTQFALVMELVVAPLLWLWRRRVSTGPR
ncbi:MAG: DUF4345 domain-containing protein [Rhodospirillales bacterium]|nr:DUF4345 domain-containing protein [Rhodospirillales bacterium]